MPRLIKAEAARQMGISRTTLYKLIHERKLSAHPFSNRRVFRLCLWL
jgi:excisionase family DNA binding protein